ncbi:MAG: hypothetical protein NVSMB47_01800 [Polyangiales bacterium]
MRWFFRLPALGLVAAAVLLAAPSRAADEELPAGSDPPRLVPLASVDAYYAYHDTPPSGGDATFASTAVRHNEFQLNLVSVGARIEHAKLLGAVILQAGTAADVLYAQPSTSPYANAETWKHIQEAHIGYRAGADIAVEAGLFPAHFGNEGFTSFSNWNYTRSMIADATPYYLAGVKAKWDASPTLAFTALVYNGWQALQDANKYKSGGLRVDWKPSDKVTVFDAVSVGPETGDGREIRYFDDLVVSLAPHPRLGIAAEGYVGLDRGKDRTRDGEFWGAAAWVRWFVGEATYFAVRGERLVDTSGLISGCGARATCGGADGQKLLGGTLTLGWFPHPMLLARAEIVHRRADRAYFAAGHGAEDRSTTFVTSMVFSY